MNNEMMSYEVVDLQEKKVVGLSARTNNASPEMGNVIGSLWQKFYTENCYPAIKNKANEKSIKKLFADMKFTFQKVGLVKYDAFNEMGGKLSFSLALLNQTNDGFVLNAVHSREGCYTYIKEIVDGNSIIVLAEEEQEALKMAMESNDSVPKTK